MQKVALIILISFFSVWDLFPQVTIKEKVEIKPKEPLSSASTSVHTIVFNLQWDRPGVQATVVGVSIPCQSAGAGWQYGGSISLTIENARAGLYWLQARVNQNPYDTTNFYFQLYFDGVIVRNGSAVLIGAFSSGSYPYFNVQYTPPLVSDYSFNLSSNELCYREFGELIIHTSNNCATGVSWNSTDLINLSITIGQEYASFYHYDFSSYFPTIELLGDNIEVTLAELADISLEQDNLFNGSNVKINVQSEWGGVIKTDSATAYPASEYVVSAESFGVEEINSGEEVFMELNVLDLLNCGFCLPLYETYNAEIIKGGEYGSLIDPEIGESVQSLTGIEQFTFGPGIPCGIANLNYIADGISADEEDSIIIRISTSDPQIQPTDKLFLIQPSPVFVDIIPDTISPGDTASVVIKKRNPDGTIEDFPPDQTFEIGIVEGCFGNLLACDGEDCYLETYLYGIPNSVPVYFVADSSADSGVVKIRAGVIEDGGGGGASIAAQMDTSGYKRKGKVKPKVERKENRSLEEKAAFIKDVSNKINSSVLSVSEKQKMFEKLNNIASPNSTTSLCFVGYFVKPMFGIDIVIIQKKEQQHTILLGETKYFQAKYPDPLSNGLIIEEVKPGLGGVPQLNGGLPIDIWGDNPVSVIECDTCGEKMGVYWEKEKPMVNNQNLPRGLIRLVGRYWHEDSTYIVKLKAKRNNLDSAEIKIRIVKPSALYSENYSGASLNKARDISDDQYNVDSLCIYYGGLYGIPPQFIKGQMATESATKTFTFDDGTSGRGFAPSYRYEPYTTQFANVDLYVDNPFVVSEGSMGRNGAAGVPTQTEHRHVRFSHYIENWTTVWDFVEAKSQFVNANNPTTFGARVTEPEEDVGKMTTVYYTINRLYNTKQREVENRLRNQYRARNLNLNQQLEANEITRNEFVRFLREEWDGGVDGGNRGLENIWAQTRIAASYGLLQILYATALNTGTGINYPVTNDDRPENLNIISTGMLYMFNHQFFLFEDNNGFSISTNSNWDTQYITEDEQHFPQPNSGFEGALRVMYHHWNRWLRDEDNRNYIYAMLVFNNTNNFLPR